VLSCCRVCCYIVHARVVLVLVCVIHMVMVVYDCHRRYHDDIVVVTIGMCALSWYYDVAIVCVRVVLLYMLWC